MLQTTDVEQGLAEERDHLEPLLDIHNNGFAVPTRPNTLNLSFTSTMPRVNTNMSEFSTITPSTVNNTPMLSGSQYNMKLLKQHRRVRRWNSEVLTAIEERNVRELERLLKRGASPNATCRVSQLSACHYAALSDCDALSLLLKFGAQRTRYDKQGRTPLHFAAWAGHVKQMAVLLDLPAALIEQIESGSMPKETEEQLRRLCEGAKDVVNARCGEVVLNSIDISSDWEDNMDHSCKEIEGSFPLIKPGWTPLHVATACGHTSCTKLLLAAGADPNLADKAGRTAMDIVGLAHYYEKTVKEFDFAAIIELLVKAGGQHTTMTASTTDVVTPLHTAVELDYCLAVRKLLEIGVSVACLNPDGDTPLHVCVRHHLEDPLKILANEGRSDEDQAAAVNLQDKSGRTVLQAAIDAQWYTGIYIALECGADVDLNANDGETAIHSAAKLGDVDLLYEIIRSSKNEDIIHKENKEGETALFKAVRSGHTSCVKVLIDKGASIKTTLPGEVTVYHVAAECGHTEVLNILLEHGDATTVGDMLNKLTDGDKRGFGPIHFAVAENHIDCVQLLLSKGADICLRTTCSPHKSSTPLHIAAVKNHVKMAKLLLETSSNLIHEVNSLGWFPLHSASHHGSRDVIILLLSQGANLARYTDGPKKFRRTAIDMIVNNLSKPTEFMDEVFSSYLTINGYNLQDPSCEVTVDYKILMPSECEMEQMKVIEALLKTGNRYGQKKLLVHPLVESFLYLKWRALLPFFYTIVAFYGIFVMSLTTYAVSVFFYKDTLEEQPAWLSSSVWEYIVYASIFLIILIELLYMNVKSSRYFFQLETWVKFGSIGFAFILPPSLALASAPDAEWPRHIATIALLLAWIHIMFLLSRFPNWGYYVLMFGKVATNVIKILLTFGFLVIGFSLSFMIQFRSQTPFEGPLSALIKTIVMMTSEFEYDSLFDEDHSKELAFSYQIVRLIFVVFLVLAAIVLMNLMVGVAVNDITYLEMLGNIRRLDKQVEFLSTLDTLVYNKLFSKVLSAKVNDKIKGKRNVKKTIHLKPGRPRWKNDYVLPGALRDAIFEIAQSKRKQEEDELGMQAFRDMLKDIHQAVVKTNAIEPEKVSNKFEPDGESVDTNVHTPLYGGDRTPQDMGTVIESLIEDIAHIKRALIRLESKL